MKLDIRTAVSEPRRQTFGYLARRFGEDRAATRYEEAVLDLQPLENFHYRPSHEPHCELYDTRRTAIVLPDWHVLLDPRQFYYATYNLSRAALEATCAKSFEFVDKQSLLDDLPDTARTLILSGMTPMRHYEWGANQINWSVTDRGFGAPVTSAAAFAAMDRLGMAQVITKLALALDGNTGTALAAAKQEWLSEPTWQGVRRGTEDMLVLDDWFEAFVAQNFAFDGIVHRFAFDELRGRMRALGGTGVLMTTEIIAEIRADQARWVDAVIKTAAAASVTNRTLVARWCADWTDRAVGAVRPLAVRLLGSDGDTVVDRLVDSLRARGAKLGVGEVAS